ncbi:MAG: hypothetical protein H7Y13_03825 [Sphingobacteriaceae bacterium]|nr:hypothetical protein [Sphingobacteriaceae bacterium]
MKFDKNGLLPEIIIPENERYITNEKILTIGEYVADVLDLQVEYNGNTSFIIHGEFLLPCGNYKHCEAHLYFKDETCTAGRFEFADEIEIKAILTVINYYLTTRDS